MTVTRVWWLFLVLASAPGCRGAASSPVPAAGLRKEIDYVFVAPTQRWGSGTAEAIDEPVASDHRPVLARNGLRPKK